MSKSKSADAMDILLRRYYEGQPEREAGLAAERENAALARRLFALRKEAGLSQRELARRVGTTPSVISRLENADYEGHSLSMLRRVAAALNRKVEVRFVTPRATGKPHTRP